MAFVEYIEQPEQIRNRDGTITAARFFKVWDATPAGIIANPSSVGLPMYGSPHPDLYGSDGLQGTVPPVLTYYTVAQQGAIVLATAYYSNEDEATNVSMTFQRVPVKYPILRRIKQTNGSAMVTRWQPDTRETTATIGRLMMVRKFARAAFGTPGLGDLHLAIISRIGDIHALSASQIVTIRPDDPDETPTPPGEEPQPRPGPQPNPSQRYWYFRFEGADVDVVNGAWVQASYSWSFDAGIRVTDEEDGIIVPNRESVLYPGEVYAVPPYQWIEHAVRADAQPTDENPYTFATGIENYRRGREVDWLGLPGMVPG